MITVNNATLESLTPDAVDPDGLPTYLPGLDLRAGAEGGGELAELMRHDAAATMDRLLAHHRAGTTDQAPRIRRQPVDSYLGDEQWRREIDRIHRRVPLPLALSCELPASGTFKAVTVVDTPVLITR